MVSGLVALIGRPNVGKSTLFNRIVQERIAIVYDTPGVTRDRIYGNASWLNRQFKVVDTGGIAKSKDLFQEKIKIQAEIAINEADIIVFLVDSRVGLVGDDHFIASLLHKSSKKVIVAVNKVEALAQVALSNEFYALGFEKLFTISAEHGIGTGDLLDEIIHMLPSVEEKSEIDKTKIALIGRPNVGKSSLVNALLDDERVIVSEVAGTTRDAIDIMFSKDDKDYILVDTAGLRRRGKIFEAIEKYSAIRTMNAIEKSNVCLCVIDSNEGFLEQDKHIINYAITQGKGIIIVANKWDLSDKGKNDFRDYIYKTLPAIAFAPIIFVSALTKAGLKDIFKVIDLVSNSTQLKLTTATINDFLIDIQQVQPAPQFNGGSLRIYYGLQEQVSPPRFTFFTNNPNYLHFSYQRHIENRMREVFGFEGSPLIFKFRKKI